MDRDTRRELDALQKEIESIRLGTSKALRPDHPAESLRRDLHDLGQVPSAGVIGTVAQTLASSAAHTTLTWDTVWWDTDQLWDSTNNWFEARVNGIYLATVSVQIADADTDGYRGLQLLCNDTNGTTYGIEYPADTANDTQLAVSGVFLLGPVAGTGAGTHVLAQAYQSSGSSIDVIKHIFNITKIADFGQLGTLQ